MTDLKAKLAEETVQTYTEFKVPFRAVLEAFIPPEELTESPEISWWASTSGESGEKERILIFTRAKCLRTVVDGATGLMKPAQTDDDQVLNRGETKTLIAEMLEAFRGER